MLYYKWVLARVHQPLWFSCLLITEQIDIQLAPEILKILPI